MSKRIVQGPSWDLSAEYPGPNDAKVEADLLELDELLAAIEQRNANLDGDDAIETAQQLYSLSTESAVLLRNLSTFASCLLSVDSHDEPAQVLQARLKNYAKRHVVLCEPLTQFTMLADEASVLAYLSDPHAAASEFLVRHSRKRSHELLSLQEETLANSLAQDGIYAWGTLYSQLSGTLKCQLQCGNAVEEMGIAQASSLLGSRVVEERQGAWRAINTAWRSQRETCAASLNAIAGWRLELVRRRNDGQAVGQTVHFLDAPTHMNRITRTTLDSLLAAAAGARPVAQRAARLQARAYGRKSIGPWDERAPAPALVDAADDVRISFSNAIEIVADAYAQVDPSMGDFIRMMAKERWIEGTLGASKRPGAYCTGFAKSRTPRVYMTYSGTASDVITLAHELGHAYHSWVMRDLPRSQLTYGMSLAETASIFGETLVRDALLARAVSPAERLDIAWEELAALVTFVLNIPARFEFEKRFYERRAERPLRPEELEALMRDSWQHWYGDVLSEPDSMYWASKLHFHISGLSFYNFPYLFGYLFSRGVYAKRLEFGADFFPRFKALLRDTGRLTAEDLASKHLLVDLRDADFWTATLATLAPRVDAFETLLDELGLAP
jgi:oligoendopeptidase F